MISARRLAIAATTAATLLVAACGSSVSGGKHKGAAAVEAVQMPLSTSVATASGSWATIVMGGPAAQLNDFWQVFERPAHDDRWVLVTPPGTADNGGLVLVPGTGQSAFTAFRPSNLLTFTPLSRTTDGGQSWSAVSPLDAPLASSPGALALQPVTGNLLALTSRGSVEQAAQGGSWRTVTTAAALAASTAGRHCGLTSLTAAADPLSGDLLLGGSCSTPGVAGLFAGGTGSWRDAGLTLPASLSRERITVLRLVASGSNVVALLQAGTGTAASLIAAWSVGGAQWSLSPPLPLRGAALASAAFGMAGTMAVTTTAGTAAVISSGARSWLALPHVPAGTAALASLSGGEVDALAVDRSVLTVWRLIQGSGWQRAQSMTVPIQYNSSG